MIRAGKKTAGGLICRRHGVSQSPITEVLCCGATALLRSALSFHFWRARTLLGAHN